MACAWQAALCTPALQAAVPAAPVVEHKTADSFTVTYQGTAKNQYVLLVVKAGTDLNSLTADSILYIDQAAADENGVAAFANLTDSTKGFLLKSSPERRRIRGRSGAGRPGGVEI